MDPFRLDIDLNQALALYLYLKADEEDLSGAPAALFDKLRSFLYERLSVGEMERPEELLSRLGGRG